MRIRNPGDLGAFIRDRRSQLGLDQAGLAKKAGTSRKWLIEVERGKPRAEIGLILRTLKALKVSLDLQADSAEDTRSPKPAAVAKRQVPDIDSVLNALKKGK
jgi:HTH-type transcriptional regulator / antitoxin HipB